MPVSLVEELILANIASSRLHTCSDSQGTVLQVFRWKFLKFYDSPLTVLHFIEYTGSDLYACTSSKIFISKYIILLILLCYLRATLTPVPMSYHS